MSKRTVNKRMIYVDWTGDWRIVEVVAESDVSVWVKPRFADNAPPQRNKRYTDGQYYEMDEIDSALRRLRDRAETLRKKAATAVERVARLEIYKRDMEKRERAQDETFELARMQDKD